MRTIKNYSQFALSKKISINFSKEDINQLSWENWQLLSSKDFQSSCFIGGTVPPLIKNFNFWKVS